MGHGEGGTAAGDLSWPLARTVRVHADKAAIVDGDRRVTYADLARRVGGLGSALDALELPEGARFGVLAANSLAHLEVCIGVPAHGRVTADLNFRLAEDELAFMVEDADVEVLLADDERLPVARALRERCAVLREVVYAGAHDCPGDCVAYEELVTRPARTFDGVDEHAPATISYTGGTTGRPKGVVLSHRNLLANAQHNLHATGHRADDRWLHVCPMFHTAGTANVFAATWVGATQILLPRFDARAVLDAIEREAITHCVFVPTMLAMLLDELDRRPADLGSLRNIQYAASPISSELQRRVLERFDCEVAQFYGMTEAAPTVTHCTPEDHRRGAAGEEPFCRRLRSVGAPVPGVQVEVRGPLGEPLPPGEIGEIWVRGPNIMLGYWRRPEATQDALADGWYHSGDGAYADEHGYLYIVDRLKDMIISGGENVYSVEVEDTLTCHAAVREAAVFGVPDPRWGEAVHAVVVTDEDAACTAEELIAHCRERIAGFKVPRAIDVRREPLPRSGAGKVLKNRLREPFWAGEDRRVS